MYEQKHKNCLRRLFPRDFGPRALSHHQQTMKGWLQDCTFSTQQYSAPGTKPICGQCCQLVVKPAADDFKTNKQSAPLQLQQPLAQLLPAVQLSVSLPFSLPQSLAVSLSFFISFFLSFSLSLSLRTHSVCGWAAGRTYSVDLDNIGIFLCQVRQSLWALTSHCITLIKCERLWAFECFSTREPVKGAHHEPQAAARKQDNYTTGGMQLNTSSFYKALTPQAGCTVWSSTCAAHTFSPSFSELSEMATRLQIAQRSCVSHVN